MSAVVAGARDVLEDSHAEWLKESRQELYSQPLPEARLERPLDQER